MTALFLPQDEDPLLALKGGPAPLETPNGFSHPLMLPQATQWFLPLETYPSPQVAVSWERSPLFPDWKLPGYFHLGSSLLPRLRSLQMFVK